MDLTLHLTERCNLRCRYCHHEKSPKSMSREILQAALRLGTAGCTHTAVSFFGGEPLLCRSLILETLDICRQLRRDTGHRFSFQLTTNGTLLDEDFLQLARANSMIVALSHDGVAQDDNRRTCAGESTAKVLADIVPLLLRCLPYAPVMLTVPPDRVDTLAESVRLFVERDGFRYLLFTPAFGPDIQWTEADLTALGGQYRRLAQLYEDWYRQGRKIWLGPFEGKIDAYIQERPVCAHTCTLGQRRVSVSADGQLYPCTQFVGDPDYCIGDVWSGIDDDARSRIQAAQTVQPACEACALRDRCRHSCGCLNKMTSGNPQVTGGEACAHEQLLIRTADTLAERLYRKKNRQFLRRHYEEGYPLVSLLEDLLHRV